MAKTRPISPEKQLLKLIEESKSNAAKIPSEAKKRRGLSLFSWGGWLGRVSFLKAVFKVWQKNIRPRQLDLKLINKFLAALILVITLYFMADFFSSLVNLKSTPNFEFSTQEGSGAAGMDTPPLLNKAAYYLEKVRARDIFTMKPADIAEARLRLPTPRIIEASEHFRLVGISWSDDPDAIIEDAKMPRTFFVKKGQMVGEFRVQAIFRDKVILSYQGEEIELK